MLSSDGDDFNRNQHNLVGIRVSTTTRSTTTTTTSSRSSSSTISSNNSPPQPPPPTTIRTMEEVWNDINLSTTNHPVTTAKSYRGAGGGFNFQDFLAKPFSTTTTTNDTGSPSPPPPPPPPQPMLLNLNSGPDQMSFLSEDPTRNVCPLDVPFDQVLASANSSSGLLSNGMWMLPATDRTGGDRRHKRMIKNRESAARSRARKQAYTNQLENEVDRLKEENARLKRQHQQLQMATAACQVTKKGGLQRATTAPF